jgi:hypothetical protein
MDSDILPRAHLMRIRPCMYSPSILKLYNKDVSLYLLFTEKEHGGPNAQYDQHYC